VIPELVLVDTLDLSKQISYNLSNQIPRFFAMLFYGSWKIISVEMKALEKNESSGILNEKFLWSWLYEYFHVTAVFFTSLNIKPFNNLFFFFFV